MSDALAANRPVHDAANVDTEQYLTFQLAEQEYGIDILRVQEIKGWDKPTRIPRSPPHVLGVINLRGAVVPVIDLRTRFGLEPPVYGTTTVVIVVRVQSEERELTAGIVVDAVCEVCNVTQQELHPPPDVAGGLDQDFVKGLAMVDERMLILLRVDRLINASVLEGAAAQAA
ncbi:MAG: chemotaxis protein CheW [Steroidobacteraceae bacterium]|nr:purine-binding chemotaxis protein CheW [Nevskiaceae bacterium]MCP5338880.1 purine-binding chemotaxis protein CheW [Nevskiaceae bacterium]MCP5360731.1 purine-binding chemotaxis protein CheW [Nevskiaceae bacterium]MCP5466205.1 purine-binding chemotaxis protein CheW [Nevskiaceae bacterium]MCP5471607.1 purine-binding chemotaxis protein CheW [Nevskiaceae bacterium]